MTPLLPDRRPLLLAVLFVVACSSTDKERESIAAGSTAATAAPVREASTSASGVPFEKWANITDNESSSRPESGERIDWEETTRYMIERLRATVFTDVAWDKRLLDEVLRDVRKQSSVNIFLTRAVEDAVPPERRIVTLSGVRLTADEVLKRSLASLGLVYVIHEGLVLVSTPEDAHAIEFQPQRPAYRGGR